MSTDGHSAPTGSTNEGRAVTVLVADDSDRYRAGIVRALGRRPEIGRILESSDGAEALLLARSARPDVVLVDARMPGMSGIELAIAVAGDRELAGLPVLLMTAEPDSAALTAGRDAGAAAYLDKAQPRSALCDAVVAVAVGRPAGPA